MNAHARAPDRSGSIAIVSLAGVVLRMSRRLSLTVVFASLVGVAPSQAA
jgi:hypothetical protein